MYSCNVCNMYIYIVDCMPVLYRIYPSKWSVISLQTLAKVEAPPAFSYWRQHTWGWLIITIIVGYYDYPYHPWINGGNGKSRYTRTFMDIYQIFNLRIVQYHNYQERIHQGWSTATERFREFFDFCACQDLMNIETWRRQLAMSSFHISSNAAAVTERYGKCEWDGDLPRVAAFLRPAADGAAGKLMPAQLACWIRASQCTVVGISYGSLTARQSCKCECWFAVGSSGIPFLIPLSQKIDQLLMIGPKFPAACSSKTNMRMSCPNLG